VVRNTILIPWTEDIELNKILDAEEYNDMEDSVKLQRAHTKLVERLTKIFIEIETTYEAITKFCVIPEVDTELRAALTYCCVKRNWVPIDLCPVNHKPFSQADDKRKVELFCSHVRHFIKYNHKNTVSNPNTITSPNGLFDWDNY